jgi:hypothetical protein
MATIVIGGMTYSGSSVRIFNGQVTIDGVVQGAKVTGVVEIKVTEGVLGELACDAAVSCSEVQGSVSAGGSVSCGKVGGSVNAGGSVTCGDVGGGVRAGGSVTRH